MKPTVNDVYIILEWLKDNNYIADGDRDTLDKLFEEVIDNMNAQGFLKN